MRYWLLLAGLVVVGGLYATPAAATTGLKIQPVEYNAELDAGQRQRGVVDISNPLDEVVDVELTVQAARPSGQDGELEFYDDEAVSAGVKLDHEQLTLQPKAAFRLVFELNASRLPPGDSVAAIFAQTVGQDGDIGSSARVGTLLFISNGADSGRDIDVVGIDVSWVQTSGEIYGQYQLANRNKQQNTGYRPTVTTQLWPLHQPQVTTGPLVFAGQQRIADIRLPTKAFGVYKLTISVDGSQQSRWVLLMPAWSALLLLGLLVLALAWRYVWRRKPHK